ncbi:MAG: polysaccharide deacetylase family protein [Syntrophobacteraceae bacterium]
MNGHKTSFRLDRFLTLHLFRVLMRPDREKAAILMYHSISDVHENGQSYFRTVTSLSVFSEQMQFLDESGYNVVDLMTLVQAVKAGRDLPPRSVALTFDDGFRDFYTDAFPVLQRHDFPATVFLVTGRIDRDAPLNGKSCLTWGQVRELDRAGITFGSHTVNHPTLSVLSEKDLEFELIHSKERIESELGKSIDSFCYPFGFPEHDRPFLGKLFAILASNDYKCCLTTRIGTAAAGDDPFRLRRLPVNSMDDSPLLEAKMAGAYDWLQTCQTVYKRFVPPQVKVI